MKSVQQTLSVTTRGRELHDITGEVALIVDEAGVHTGLCNVFLRHTSASLVIQENADPAVLRDLATWIERVAPENDSVYEHNAEGPDDMPAHIRAVLARTSETIPIANGRLALGTWQALYVWEHRRASHHRQLIVHVCGT